MTFSEKQEINDATGTFSEEMCHNILFHTTTNFLTCPMLTLYFFLFFIIILKHILRNTNFDYRVISVGSQDELQELNPYSFSSLYSAKFTLSIAFPLNPLKPLVERYWLIAQLYKLL